MLFVLFSFLLRKNFCYVLTAILLIAIIPIALVIQTQFKINKNLGFDETETLVCGRICENPTYTSSGSLKLVLDTLSLTNSEQVASPSGKFTVYVSPHNLDIYNFTVGSFVEVISKVYITDLDDGYLSNLGNGNIGYTYCYFYEIELTGEKTLLAKEKFKQYILQKLENSGTLYPDVAYAMLFGDTSLIDTSISSIFSDAGIAHLLAVSGLHISVLLLVLEFLLKKLKISTSLRTIIEFVLLGLYCYVCNFSVSVLRASIMGILNSYALMRHKPYDSFSALSLSACLILMVNPLKLFTLSFIYSFGSVFIIILIVKPLTRFFSKFFGNRVAGSLALVTGIQLGIVALNLYYFGEYPVLSIVSNFISVPLQSFAFGCLLVLLPFTLVLPFSSIILKVFGILTSVVVKINNFILGFGSTIVLESLSFLPVILMFLFMFFASDRIFMKNKYKFVTCLVFLGLFVISFFI